jgi:anti-sigma-K factor RskA
MEKDRERMLELLADQTLFGLTDVEKAELENLKNRFPEFKDDNSFEMSAATINLINLRTEDSLPADLQAKLEASAQEFFNSPEKARQFSDVERNRAAVASKDEIAGNIYEVSRKPSIWQWLGWAVAAAACIALAINLWLTRVQPQPEIAKTPQTIQTPEPVKTPAPELSAAQKREQLLASAPDVIQTNWTSAKDDKRVLGDVVWSNSQQKGFVRLRDLPALNPNEETYQLWIIDKTRDAKTPLSGGTFDASETGEIIIPINAQLRINEPAVFAISKEKAGGVVVSKPDRLVAVAKV